MADVKKILKEVLEKAKAEKAREDEERTKKNDTDRTKILEGVGGDLTKSLQPVLAELAKSSRMSEEQIRNALSEAIQINMPGVDTESISNAIREAFSGITFPEPIVNVTVPETKFPEIKIPETKFPDRMSVGLENYSDKTPLPVRLMDTGGKPFVFSFPSSGGGGKSDFFTVKGIQNTIGIVSINPDGSPAGSGSVASSVSVSDIFGTTGTNVVNPDGRLKVELPTGASGLTDTELRATAVPVSQLSGAGWSTSVTDIFGTVGANAFNPDNRLKVELPSGASGLTDTELRATSLTVQQLSGIGFSVSVTDIFGSTGTGFYNLDNRLRVELPGFTQVVSSADIFATTSTSSVVNADNRVKVELPAQTVTVSSVTATIAAANIDSTGVQYSGSNPMPFTLAVSNATSTINAVIVDSSGVGFNGTNPMPITVSGAISSTVAVGDIASGTADTGSAPLKTGGISRTTNPAAEADGDRITYTADDLGRQVMRPVQVRDLIQTAYVSVTNGTETTLRAAVAGAFLDLIMIVGSNNSDAAVSVDIRPVTAGNIINTLRIPANGTAGWTPPVPWPQTDTGNAWTVDGPDETGRTLTFSALFSQEI